MRSQQVRSADGHPRAAGGGVTLHLRAVLRTLIHEVSGNDPVRYDAGLVVDVLQKEVERAQALAQSGVEQPPLDGGHDAGHAVHGDDPLLSFLVPVHREEDPLVQKGVRHPLLDSGEAFGGEAAQRLIQLSGVLTRGTVRQQHLVVDGGVEIVGVEVHRA